MTNAAPCGDRDEVDRVIVRIGPGGGPAYAAMRAWNVLIWQPVLVAVLCAEAEGRAAEVDQASYVSEPPFGCRLGRVPTQVKRVRQVAARHLDLATTILFEALSQRRHLRLQLARRQVADRVLVVLERRAMLGFAPVAATRDAAADWLAALGLDGLSALEPMALDGGAEGLWLCRRSCCLEYRAMPDFLCATCPRRDRATRITLSRDAWQAHVRA